MSLVPSIFSAAYSLEIAIHYPILTCLLSVAIVTLLRIEIGQFQAIGALAGAVVAGSVAHHNSWKPLQKTSLFLSLASVVVFDFFLSSWGSYWTAIARLASFVVDMISLPPNMFVTKTGVLGLALGIHLMLHLIFPKLATVDLEIQVKYDIFFFLVFAGFTTLSLSYILKKKEEEE